MKLRAAVVGFSAIVVVAVLGADERAVLVRLGSQPNLAQSNIAAQDAAMIQSSMEQDPDVQRVLRRLSASEDAQMDAAAAAWGSARAKQRAGAANAPLQKISFIQALELLGKLRVISMPDGGIVTVDGYRWLNPTEANGWAEQGRRTVVVTKDTMKATVQCMVTMERMTTAQLDLTSGSGICLQ